MYGLTDSQKEIVEKTRTITADSIAPYAAKTDSESRYPIESMNAIKGAGLLGLLVPENYGGMDQDLRTMVAVLEVIAKECSSTALCYLVHLAGSAAYAASDPPKENLLRAVARGDHLSALALGEFGSRSHFWAPMSRAERRNGRIVLNASKSFVTGAGYIDGLVFLTRYSDGKTPTETSVYYVPADGPGINVSGNWDALGLRGNASAPVVFKEVTVPRDYALSEPGDGMNMLLTTMLPVINLGVAAICIGIAEATIAIALQHVKNSKLQHLSSTLADLPNQRARLARMRLETDKVRAHVSAVLKSIESDSPDATLMVLESKAAASEMVLAVTDIAMKAAGGTAFNKKLGLERRFRDARAADFLGVTTDMLLEFIGRSMCDMPIP